MHLQQNWNGMGKNEAGSIVESGIYVYQVKVGDVFSTGTVVLANDLVSIGYIVMRK